MPYGSTSAAVRSRLKKYSGASFEENDVAQDARTREWKPQDRYFKEKNIDFFTFGLAKGGLY
jgi:hypothetical protein